MAGKTTRGSVLVARIATTSFALATLFWAWQAAPTLWSQPSMAQMARKIVGGERYRRDFLAEFAEATARSLRRDRCAPVARRTLAVTRLRLAEEAIAAGDETGITRTQSDLDVALLDALDCAPTDPLLWLARFWLQNNTRGLQQDNFKALTLSYRFGPNEGWLALRRSRFALAVYPALPDDLKQQAIDEFVQLVKSDFITDAADIVAGPGRPISELLLSRLEGIDIVKLKFLARLLDGRDFEARVPGVEVTRPRPW
ncbi:hypothetical protein [Bradyrhizobium sp.]|uniref:hypothetical protein n=1 Tax=Bradyrhizobium sp. TaxID=376 RepID=UPI001ED35D33|nr:hypothetical protein [Bradyrhizobium sp.]MBV9985230.1 hypothetical protein [Bradyrhizobium sp.]